MGFNYMCFKLALFFSPAQFSRCLPELHVRRRTNPVHEMFILCNMTQRKKLKNVVILN